MILNNGDMILNEISRYYPVSVGRGAVQRVALDQTDMEMILMYVVNTNNMTIDIVTMDIFLANDNESIDSIDFMKQTNMTIDIKDLTGIQPNDITSIEYDSNNDMIYITVIPYNISESGYLFAIDAETMELNNMTMQPLDQCFSPKSMIMTNDTQQIIVACSGQEINDIMPQIMGSIHIINITTWSSMNYDLSDIGNNIALRDNTGIYRYYNKMGVSFGIEAEPFYLSLDTNNSYLYVTLQETNAIAIFDLDESSMKFVDVLGLGFKSYSMNGGLDASDMDNKINIDKYPGLYAIRQPSMVQYYHDEQTGNTYLISINQGKDKGFDAVRVSNITLNATIFNMLYTNMTMDELTSDEKLGRLMVSNLLGDNGKEYESLYTFGSRDFSIYKLNEAWNLSLIYESNDTFEQVTAEQLGTIGFNSEAEDTPSFDEQSPLNGPAPISSVFGKCYDTVSGDLYNLLFIASKSVGGIFVYDITDMNDITLLQYINNRDFTNKSYYDDYTRPNYNAGDVGIEQLKYIQSENGEPLLMTVSSISSSITVYKVNCTSESGGGGGGGDEPLDESTEKLVILILAIVFGVVLLAGIIIFIYFKCFEGPKSKPKAPADYVELN